MPAVGAVRETMHQNDWFTLANIDIMHLVVPHIGQFTIVRNKIIPYFVSFSDFKTTTGEEKYKKQNQYQVYK